MNNERSAIVNCHFTWFGKSGERNISYSGLLNDDQKEANYEVCPKLKQLNGKEEACDKKTKDAVVKKKSKPTKSLTKPATKQNQNTDFLHSAEVKSKMTELDNEIAKYKEQNARVLNQRREKEDELYRLRKEQLEQRKVQDEELKNKAQKLKEEKIKFDKEKRLFEIRKKCLQVEPRTVRNESQILREKIALMESENTEKEKRWKSRLICLESRMKELELENHRYKKQIEDHVLPQSSVASCNKKSSHRNTEKIHQIAQICSFDRRVETNAAEVNEIIAKLRISSTKVLEGRRPRSNDSLEDDVNFPVRPEMEDPMINDGEIPESERLDKDGKTIRREYSKGITEIQYEDGTREIRSADPHKIHVYHHNGDVEQKLTDGTIIYLFNKTLDIHEMRPDGTDFMYYKDGQVEMTFGHKTMRQIIRPDRTIERWYPDGSKKTFQPSDGAVVQENPNGCKLITFRDGRVEFHASAYKKATHPNGTVKIVQSNGLQHTVFPDGRVNLKKTEIE